MSGQIGWYREALRWLSSHGDESFSFKAASR